MQSRTLQEGKEKNPHTEKNCFVVNVISLEALMIAALAVKIYGGTMDPQLYSHAV